MKGVPECGVLRKETKISKCVLKYLRMIIKYTKNLDYNLPKVILAKITKNTLLKCQMKHNITMIWKQ